MADNYLEKRYEEIFGSGAKSKCRKTSKPQSLNSLLLKNRSHRIYNQDFLVSEEQLRSIVEVCTKIPSARNQQILRYKLVLGDQADIIKGKIRLGGHAEVETIAPRAYIIICSTVEESRWVDVDLGIAAQSMLLKTVELGLRGICIGAFSKEAVAEALSLPYEPLLIIGIGKSDEAIQLTSIRTGQSQSYYERDGIHFVPKLHTEDILL